MYVFLCEVGVCLTFAQKLMLNKAFLWLRRKNVLINAKYILKLTHTIMQRTRTTALLNYVPAHKHRHPHIAYTHSAHSHTDTLIEAKKPKPF